MSPLTRRATLTLPLALLGGIGCSEASTDGGTSSGTGSWNGGADDLSDVIYEGGATDEALVVMLGRSTVGTEADGPGFSAPTEGAAVPAAPPFEFEWSAMVARREESFLERALSLLLGEGEAYAHGAPISGRAYFVVFQTPTNPKLLRVFTTNLSYTPDAAAWEKLVSAGQFTARIGTAIFDENKVADGGGPFVGKSRSMIVQ